MYLLDETKLMILVIQKLMFIFFFVVCPRQSTQEILVYQKYTMAVQLYKYFGPIILPTPGQI